MDRRYHTRAKVMTLIPLVVFVVSAAILIPLTVSYFSTGSDPAAVALIFAGSMCLIFTAMPCFVLAIVGTASAAKSKQAGFPASQKFYAIGIVEIILYSLGLIGAVIATVMTVIAAG